MVFLKIITHSLSKREKTTLYAVSKETRNLSKYNRNPYMCLPISHRIPFFKILYLLLFYTIFFSKILLKLSSYHRVSITKKQLSHTSY